MEQSMVTPSLEAWLRRALRHLYDPAELRTNRLFGCLIRDEHAGPLALQGLLTTAIDELKPDAHLAPQADAWRLYRVLTHRFVEQFTQQEVASSLGLSIRQLRREEQRALELLAAHLLRRYPEKLGVLANADESDAGATNELDAASDSGLTSEQELAWLERSIPNEPADVPRMVAGVLETTRPLLEELNVRTRVTTAGDVPWASIQEAAVRQALLGLVTAIARAMSGGEMRLTITGGAGGVGITLAVVDAVGACDPGAFAEAVEMARQLVALSGGTLDILHPRATDCTLLRLDFPVLQSNGVLVIDDNADTLHLYERYLAQSTYRFVGLQLPQEAVALASRILPAMIVLDVMLPEIDGWELLGRLRESPATGSIPVIVSTILPQEEFALALGAAAFLRKPFTQAQLLAVLDRVLAAEAAPSAR
jgi:CheY-like chemotaxis protein